MPTVANSISTGNSKRAMFSRSMNRQAMTRLTEEPSRIRPFMKLPKPSRTNSPSNANSRAVGWVQTSAKVVTVATVASDSTRPVGLPCLNTPTIKSAMALNSRNSSGAIVARS